MIQLKPIWPISNENDSVQADQESISWAIVLLSFIDNPNITNLLRF